MPDRIGPVAIIATGFYKGNEMKQQIVFLLIAALFFMAGCGPDKKVADEDAAKEDATKVVVEGVWIVDRVWDGADGTWDNPKNLFLRFTGSKVEFVYWGLAISSSTFTIKHDTTPMQFDTIISDGDKETQIRGIIKVSETALTICYAAGEKNDRPSDFTADKQTSLTICRRPVKNDFPPGTDVSDKVSNADIFATLKSSSYDKTRQLSPNLALVESHIVAESQYSGLADNNKRVVIAQPVRHDSVDKKTLLHKGKSIYSTKSRPKFYASPDERSVLLASYLHSKPFKILNVSSGAIVDVPVPKSGVEDHDYVYPFSFGRWSKDSTSIIAYVAGSYLVTEPKREYMAYRETWRIDARTGVARKESRQTQVDAEDLKWDDDVR
jgi:uncharacterized protein (TIGR03067 family)